MSDKGNKQEKKPISPSAKPQIATIYPVATGCLFDITLLHTHQTFYVCSLPALVTSSQTGKQTKSLCVADIFNEHVSTGSNMNCPPWECVVLCFQLPGEKQYWTSHSPTVRQLCGCLGFAKVLHFDFRTLKTEFSENYACNYKYVLLRDATASIKHFR